MNAVNLTDMELEVIRTALRHLNDFENDTALENADGLFPGRDDPTILTMDKAKELREQLSDVLIRQDVRHNAMRKFGVTWNERTGYSD
jgi:hypothetical protein